MEDYVRKPYAVWTVGSTDYKLRLRASDVMYVEDKLGKPAIEVIASDGIPSLSDMLHVIKAAMQKFHHGVTLDKVTDIYDQYIDFGGSQMELFKDVVVPIYSVSGFFTAEASRKMDENLEAAKEEL